MSEEGSKPAKFSPPGGAFEGPFWDYVATETSSSNVQATLDEAGRLGWELFHAETYRLDDFHPSLATYRLIFRRQR